MNTIKSFRFEKKDQKTWNIFKGKVAREGRLIKDVMIELIQGYNGQRRSDLNKSARKLALRKGAR